MSQVGNHSFEFPASQGVQGGTVTLFLTIPRRSLARFLASDNYVPYTGTLSARN